MAIFNYPHHIDKDTPATAVEVQSNFDALLTWVMDNVMLKDGSLPATGPIVLPPGPPAAPDHAASKAYVDAVVPIGIIWEYGGTQLPEGWLWCDGQVYTTGQHQELYNKIQRAFTGTSVPQGSFQVPDKRGKFAAGVSAGDAAFALGKSDGGQRNSELISHFHTVPEHGHTASGSADVQLGAHDHGWSGTTSQNGSHGHNLGHGELLKYYMVGGTENAVVGGNGQPMANAQWLHDGAHQHSVSGTTDARNLAHGHNIGVTVNNQVAFNTNPNGAGTTNIDKNLPPYVVVNYIIYRGKL